MHRDTFIFLKEHELKAKKILDIFLEQSRKYNYEGIVCVAGCSGVGKSEIAWFLSRQLYKLGLSSHIVNMDRLYLQPPEYRNEARKKTGIIGRYEMDWSRINKEVKIFYDNNIRVLIFEGLYAGYIDGIKFLVKGSIEDTEKFRKDRGKENEDDEFRKVVVQKEYEEVMEAQYDYEV